MHAPVTTNIDDGFTESFLLNGEDKPKKVPKRWERAPFFTASQKAGLKKLEACAKLFKVVGRSQQGGFRPKLWKLLLGQTGAGKTNLANSLSKTMSWPLLAIDCGSWIVSGAYTKPSTLHVVRDFVRKHDEGLLFLDELCKAVPVAVNATSWSLGVFSEILSCIDADSRLMTHEWTQADLRKFRSKFFLMGGGAFQAAFKAAQSNSRKGTLGFRKKEERIKEGYAAEIYQADLIPDEIITRFSAKHIVLSTPDEADLREAVLRIHQELDIVIEREIDEVIAEALESNAGMRWIEDYVASLLLLQPEKVIKNKEHPHKEPEKERDFFRSDLWHYLRRSNDACGSLRVTLGKIWGELAKAEVVLKSRSEARFRHFLYGKTDTVSDLIYRAMREMTLVYDTTNLENSGTEAIRAWSLCAWEGITHYSLPLGHFGLMPTWVRAWESSVSIVEIRMRILATHKVGKLE